VGVWTRTTALIGVALPVVVLAACGGPTTTTTARHVPTTSAPTTTVPVTTTTSSASASPPCDAATMATVAARFNRYASVRGFGCSGDYAFASITISGPPPYAGTEGTLLLTANQGSWQVVNRTTYCASGSVPADIYQPACGNG
jgi:hypothetical protein